MAQPKKISFLKRFTHYYWVFHRYVGHRTLLLASFSLITALTEGLGITIFVAYLQDLATKSAVPSPVVDWIKGSMQAIGLPPTPGYIISLMVFVFFVRGCFVLLAKSYHFSLHTGLTRSMTADMVAAISKMSYRKYLGKNSGYFASLITKDIPRSVAAFYQFSVVVPLFVSISTYLVLSVRLEWRFTMLSIAFGVLIAVIFRSVNAKIRGHSLAFTKKSAELFAVALQMIQSFKYLYSTASLMPLREKVGNTTREVAEAGASIGYLSAILPASSETIIVAFLGITVYLQVVILGGDISKTFIAMMFLYRTMRESTTLQGSWQAFCSYVGDVDNLTSAIDELTDGAERSHGTKVNAIEKEIRLENVQFQYGERRVLEQINLRIPARTTVALVGASGAGKSTMVDLITGILVPSAGSISIDGHSYSEIDLSSVRAKIGYVTQESVVFDDSVANNVSLWKAQQEPVGEREKVIRALKRANCLSFVETMGKGIDEVVGERGVRLSGGQRQRLSIARELYKDPQLLILDEATSALDTESEQLVQESIDGLRGQCTVIVIAHRLSTVKNADQIFVLNEGRLVEQGSFRQLLETNGLFRKMCEMQSLT